MIKYDIEKISKEIMYNGFFSEYLPVNFNLNGFDIFDIDLKNENDYVEPYKYTMSRFSENDKRRVIGLPEITTYINVVKYMNKENIFKELIDKSLLSTQSFSKVLQKSGELYKHEQAYGSVKIESKIEVGRNEDEKSTFLTNIISKFNTAKGAKGVLYLDIANFFGSIYTHVFPVIVLGYDETMKQYKGLNTNTVTAQRKQYEKYGELDKRIRAMNGNRTNGLLTGPVICQIIAESLLTMIDIEISKENIKFTRYVDDYEIYIYDDKDIEKTTNIISNILNKYYLYLNNEKTKYVSFPYYKFENLDKIITSYGSKLDSFNLIELFNTFLDLEEEGTRGAIRYLIKSIKARKIVSDEELFSTYLLNILVNDNRSLSKVCELLIQEKGKLEIDKNFKLVIHNLLISCIDSKKDLEVIWLLYLMKSIGIVELYEDTVWKIIKSENELAIIILIYEFEEYIKIDEEEEIVNGAKSWILLYQLFLKNKICKDMFSSRIEIKKNIKFYNKLKYEKFSFYKVIE